MAEQTRRSQMPIRNDLIEEERLQEKVRRLEAKKQSEVPGDAGYNPEVFAKNQVIRNPTLEERIAKLEKEVNKLKLEIAIERNRRR